MNKELIEGLTDVFFPAGIKCIVCDDDIPYGSRFPLCERCHFEFNTTFCMSCGRHMSVASQYCPNCKDKLYSFSKARAPFVYRGDIRRIVHKLKYGNGKYIAKEIAVYLADEYFEQGLTSDIITFVPMHAKKQRQRGYNQAEELARYLGEAVGCEVLPLLKKIVMTESNAGQNAEQRAESVKDVFELTNDLPREIKGKSILLVDDVFTTGATANECARVLVKAKVAKVNVLTFATAVNSENLQIPHRKLKDMPSV